MHRMYNSNAPEFYKKTIMNVVYSGYLYKKMFNSPQPSLIDHISFRFAPSLLPLCLRASQCK